MDAEVDFHRYGPTKGATVAAYTAEQREEWIKKICDALEDGDGLKTICDRIKFYRQTFLDWCDADKDLHDRYMRARARGCRAKADNLPALAREAIGQPPEVVNAYRLLIDTEKWALSKILPKEYGDKLELAGDKDTPLTIVMKKYAAPDA